MATGMAIALLAAFTPAYARDIKFEASIDNKDMVLGERGQLGLTFYETNSIPAPDIGNIDGFEVRYLGPSTMVTVINGKMSSSITHMYSLVPLKIGKFELGPFSFKYKGDTYTSNVIIAEVKEEKAVKEERAGPEEGAEEKIPDVSDRLFMVLNVGSAHAYVNELIPATVKLYVNRMNVSDIQLPVFAQEGFSKIEFREPKQYKEEMGGVVYEVLEFKTQIFGTRPGEYRLGPATIKCNLVVRKKVKRPSQRNDFFRDEFFDEPVLDDFFMRYERYPLELKSQDFPIIISPLPAEGRPASFSGAVGDYQFIFNASPTRLKAGDPITLKMEINGTGNFNTVLMPALSGTDGFKVYEPQVRTGDRQKVFTQVLIPESDNVKATPKAVFSYFDTATRAYKTISQGPIPLTVERPKEETPAQVVGPRETGESKRDPSLPQEEAKRDIIYIKDSLGRVAATGGSVHRKKYLIAIPPVSLLFLLAFYLFSARRYRLERDIGYVRRTAAYKATRRHFRELRKHLRANDPKKFYETLFILLQDYFGGRLNMPSAGITLNTIEPLLEAYEPDPATRVKIKALFEICDEARFAFAKPDDLRMRGDMRDAENIIRYLERTKG